MLLSKWSSFIRSALRHRSPSATGRRRTSHGFRQARSMPAVIQILEDRQLLSGALLTVTTTSDAVSHTGLSLRDAVAIANIDGSGDTIQFDPALSGSTITLAQGELLVSCSVLISGTAGGSSGITIDGGNASRIFDLKNATSNSKAVTITDLTLTHGNGLGANSTGSGGAIVNFSKLSLVGVTFTANTATVAGGAVDNRSTLSVTNCTFVGNKVTGTNGTGGAISNRFATISVLANSTIIGNSATGTGSTGGGVGANFTGTSTTVINSLIVGNTAVASNNDVSGTLSGSSKTNLIGIPLGKTLSDIVQTSSGAAVLANNGGPTQTVALIGSANNPAYNVGTSPLATLSANVANAPQGTLTVVPVSSAQYLAAGDLLQIDSEIVQVISIAGNNMSVMRGVLGSTPSSHTSGTGLLITDQRGQLRHASLPDLGAFETQSTTLSITAPGGVYNAGAIAVTDATVTSGVQTVATFGSPYLSYTYYAGTLSVGDIPSAIPLPGAPTNAGNYTVVGNYDNAPGYRPSTSSPVHFTISQATLTISAVTDTKQYDKTTTSSATPSIVGLQGLDTASAVQAFQSVNVLGIDNSVLYIVSFVVNDGNGGNNYTVDSSGTATGTITKAPLVITAVTATKQYDATLTATGTPVVLSPLYGSDTVTNLTQAFQDKNVHGVNGSSIAMTSWSVNDGNNGNNYDDQFSTALGTITEAPLTISAVTASKPYDRNTSSTVKPVATGLLGNDTFNGSQVYNSAIPTTYPSGATTLSVSNYVILDGNLGKNYSITQVNTAPGTITLTAAKLVFQDAPVRNITAGVPIYSTTSPLGTVPVSVAIKDPTGTYIVNTDNSTVRIALSTGTFASSGASYVEIQAVNGVATFPISLSDPNALLITKAGSYGMKASIPALPLVTNVNTSSNTIVAPDVVAQLTFSTQPSNGTVNTALGAFVVNAVDQYGNVVSGKSVTLSINSGPSGATISGASATTNSSGDATFSATKLSKTGTYTLKASVTLAPNVFVTVISNSFVIS
ncbi:MAG: hypothetical protein JSS02_24335 [Planctomycetes bacterium]|nr:hypothetical protein [Planctomycetota bacterium]